MIVSHFNGKIFAAFAGLSPGFLKKIFNRSASIVLLETILVLAFLRILKTLLNALTSFPVLLLIDTAGLILFVNE